MAKKPKAVLTLGRYGDVLNSIPIAYHLWKTTGQRPGYIIAKDYADILEGVSYVEPLIFDGPFEQVGVAFDQFVEDYDVHVAQVYGSNWVPRTESFCTDAWQQAGFGEYFDDRNLVFDKQDAKRQNDLVNDYIFGSENPTILINLSGNSSPIWCSEELIKTLHHTWDWKVNFVDLAEIKAHRIYDLLSLYDTADLLISSDSSTLHLANGSDIPSICFIADTPSLWHGSVPPRHCVLDVRYKDIWMRMSEIHGAIARITWET